jgi:hypothetical protein
MPRFAANAATIALVPLAALTRTSRYGHSPHPVPGD